MPLVYQHNINGTTKLGVWQIEEDENFFLARVPLGRGITHAHKRLQHLAGRFLLQEMFPDFPYHLIEIADTRKPFLPNEEYHFSISHCGNYAAVIVSKDCRVGIDIELFTERIHKIKHKFLSQAELAFLDGDVKSLVLAWSVKEAMYKWLGSGGVDFSEHLNINPFERGSMGSVATSLCFGELTDLQVNYKLFEGFSLAWTKS